ncbi:hypothetical protein EW053_36205 [Streptomyces sp. IB2014 016-6]|nr:hypothetical protein EW053_36205 [Streptomyces sp. IB2014 016-6]
MTPHRRNRRRAALAVTAVMAAAAAIAVSTLSSAETTAITLPPARAGLDYQLGGAYPLPNGVQVVSRDWKASPADGVYNICYINAFQTQESGEVPDGIEDWDEDLLLNDGGDVVIDPDWDEAILDITTAAKRQRIAERITAHVDVCASKGFQAVELDNFDTFTRDVVKNKITPPDAEAYIRTLSTYAHGKGLAVGQKNTVELAPRHTANGLDFAIAEQCGEPEINECGDYIDAFGDHAVFIEYTDAGLRNACAYKERASIVRRDEGVSPIGDASYVRKTC